MDYEKNINYAGFWKRFAAGFVDWIIFSIPVVILSRIALNPALVTVDPHAYLMFAIWFNIVASLANWIYISCSF